MVRRQSNSTRLLDDSSSIEAITSRKGARLGRIKSQLSSSGSLNQQHKAGRYSNDGAAKNGTSEDLEEEVSSELGPMTNDLQEAAHHHSYLKEPQTDIVGDTMVSKTATSIAVVSSRKIKDTSFENDHEQDEASLAKLELRGQEEESGGRSTRTTTTTTMLPPPPSTSPPESPSTTIQTSKLKAHTPETVASAADYDEPEVPIDERAMDEEQPEDELQQQSSSALVYEKEETCSSSDSVSTSVRTPPRNNRKGIALAAIFAGVEDDNSAATDMPNIAKEEEGSEHQGSWLRQFMQDTFSTITKTADVPIATSKGKEVPSPMPASGEANPDTVTSIVGEGEKDDDDDAYEEEDDGLDPKEEKEDIEYVSLSDRIPRKNNKKHSKKAKRMAKMKNMMNCSGPDVVWENNSYDFEDENSDIFDKMDQEEADRRSKETSNSFTPFFAAIESMIGEIVPETIGKEEYVPMCACTTEGAEDETDAKAFEEAANDLVLYA
ncbi:unnamed protein product [Cylindrotheca closterium]|uniref:Uncharacterized protein n=1 Tax=Cylindrotheca closterium TaxID=2856 RepID=A0AAD2JKX6_9STRA|nr:unnamed protein product [Cylindrotheca closterium]